MAARTGFTPPTLRFYEQIHLIPRPRRDASGYRVFTDEDMRRLDFIARAKRLGFPLDEIRHLAEAWSRDDCQATRARLLALLDSRLDEIGSRIDDLTRLEGQLRVVRDDLCSSLPRARCDPGCGCSIDLGTP